MTPTRRPLTALVVDDSTNARRRVGTMLQLGGWQVHQATGTAAALRIADEVDPDLVVTDFSLRGGDGAALLHRLHDEGCRARSIVVARRPTELVRAQAMAAGAMACLAKPVEPRQFLDLMHGLSGRPNAAAPVSVQDAGPSAIHVAAERLDRVQEMYSSALPRHLSAIAASAQEGDVAAVAATAWVLAGISAEAGHAEVAWVSQWIAADAGRGVLSHARLMQLVAVSAMTDRGRAAVTGQATSR
ncbi:MAG: response regulator [Blastococcus sp.]